MHVENGKKLRSFSVMMFDCSRLIGRSSAAKAKISQNQDLLFPTIVFKDVGFAGKRKMRENEPERVTIGFDLNSD